MRIPSLPIGLRRAVYQAGNLGVNAGAMRYLKRQPIITDGYKSLSQTLLRTRSAPKRKFGQTLTGEQND
jgi:hypothetical protein